MKTFFSGLWSWVKGDWWKTFFTIVIVALIVLLCGPCILQSIMNFVTQRLMSFSQIGGQRVGGRRSGAIYPYEWCSYYELRASRGGNKGGNRTGSILKAGLHLGPDCGLWAICPVSMETTYQLENKAPWMEEPQSLYLDSLLPKRIP